MSDKNSENFEDFVYQMQEINPYQDFSLTELLRQTWNHQQKKIDELEKQLELRDCEYEKLILSLGDAPVIKQKLQAAEEENRILIRFIKEALQEYSETQPSHLERAQEMAFVLNQALEKVEKK